MDRTQYFIYFIQDNDMNKIKMSCEKCGGYYSTNNIVRHIKSCNGNTYIAFEKRDNCKFCEKNFINMNGSERANHTRWCEKNPRASEYRDKIKNTQIKAVEANLNREYKLGRFVSKETRVKISIANKNRKMSEETKEKMRQVALKSKNRRLLRSMRDYIRKDGSIVKLDSSWEEALAKRLDYLGIDWIRPEPIEYELENIIHNYFPDFYLPRYDIFLDPKNKYALKVQKDKIDVVVKILPNLIIITTLEECENFVP